MTEANDKPEIIAMLCAVRDRDMNALKALLAQGADVNGRNVRGITPLAWAAGENKLDFVCVLLEAGARVNVVDDYGMTPLMKAVATGNIKLVRLLIERGADMHAKAATSGATAERIAFTTGHADIENYLRETAKAQACHVISSRRQAALRERVAKRRLRPGGPS